MFAGISHTFGKRKALNDVSFAIRPGDFTVLLGQNGAGKTTLFALATRLYHASSGRITVFGMDIQHHPAAALSRMGVVFQQPTLDLDLTVEQNLFYHAALHGLPSAEAAKRVATGLEQLGLPERRRDRVKTLSGGQRRRVELARALLHRPDLLLLDEPTVGLDIASRQFLIDHVRQLCATRDIAVLWATHLIDETGDDAQVVVLHRGRVLRTGQVAQFKTDFRAASMQDALTVLTSQDSAVR